MLMEGISKKYLNFRGYRTLFLLIWLKINHGRVVGIKAVFALFL